MSVLEKELTPRELNIILRRTGLTTGGTETLDSIGKDFKLTRERIRQLEGLAYRKLRRPRVLRELRDLL